MTFLHVYSIIDVAFSGIISRNNLARIANNYRMARHVTIDIRTRRDQNIVSNCYLPHNDRIRPNPYAIPNRWTTFALATVFCTYSHAFMQIAV